MTSYPRRQDYRRRRTSGRILHTKRLGRMWWVSGMTTRRKENTGYQPQQQMTIHLCLLVEVHSLIDDWRPFLIDGQHKPAMYQRPFGVPRVMSKVLGNVREPERNRDPLFDMQRLGFNREIDQLLSGPGHLSAQVLLVQKMHSHALLRIDPWNDFLSFFMVRHAGYPAS
jgi:hypothetical protein